MSTLTPWIEPDPPEAARITELLETDPELPTFHPELRSWVPDTLGKAEWAMAKLANAERLLDALGVQRTEFIDRINAWYTAAARPLARTVDFFSMGLQRYALEHRRVTGQATVAVPSGKVGTRKAPARVLVDDEAAVIAWARQLDRVQCIRSKESIVMAELTKLVTVKELPVAYIARMTDGTWREYAGVVTLDDVPVVVGEVLDGVIVESLEPVLVHMAVDSAGVPVPGLSVQEEQVTATVKPR